MHFLGALLLTLLSVAVLNAQTTSFTYQRKLTDSGETGAELRFCKLEKVE